MDLESERRRDEICVEFEAALKKGDSARVEDFLNLVPKEHRVKLLADLLPLEQTYAQMSEVPVEEYLRRFPDYEETVRKALGEMTSEVEKQALVSSCNFQLSEFEISRELGRGGMGVVYEAIQKSLKRRVALKVVSPGLGMSTNAVMRFKREAQAAGRLHHTNIVPIYFTGEENGIYYYAMEFIDGPSLDKVITSMRARESADEDKLRDTESGLPSNGSRQATQHQQLATTEFANHEDSLSDNDSALTSSLGDSSALRESRDYFDRVAGIVAEVAEALEHAHENGVIHRDIKPANLMIAPNGHLSITDFGLSRMLEQPGMTMSGEFVGSPLYMSPEQIAVGRVDLDHRTDIYSLGATLYELLTLQPPYPGERRDQVISQILTKDPIRPRGIDRRIPTDLETICLKSMEKDPDRRYQRAGLFAEDLRKFVARHAISARRIGPIGRLIRLADRHRALSTALGFILILIVVLLVTVRMARQERLTNAKRDAIELAFRGNLESAKKQANRAESLGADPAWRYTVEGVFSLYKDMGASGRAVNVLTKAADFADTESERLSARALLATAYVWSGKWSLYKRLISTLEHEHPSNVDETSRFFLGQSLMWHDPVRARKLLESVRFDDSWKDTGMIATVYAESLGHAAWETDDLSMAMECIRESERAVSILQDNPLLPLAVRNWGTIVAVTLSRSEGRPESETSELLNETFPIVKRIEQFPDYDIGYPNRAWCFDALNNPGNEEFMKVMHECVAVRGNAGWMAGMYAAELFRYEQSGKALPIMNGLRTRGEDPIVDTARVILMLDSPNPDVERVERICRDYEKMALAEEINDPAAWAALVMRLRGKDLRAATKLCGQLREFSPPRGPKAVDVILGKTDAKSLLHELSGKKMERCLNAYLLGLYFLSCGDEDSRQLAREIMLPAVKAGGRNINPETHWIRAVYEREFGPTKI